MARVANASFAADGKAIVRSPDDLRTEYAGFRHCVPLRDVVLAEAGGELAGYGRTAGWWTLVDGTVAQAQVVNVAPEWRGRGIEQALQEWIEARQREIAATLSAPAFVHHAFLTEGETARAKLLEGRGYTAARHFYDMVRPDLDDLPEFPLPPGFEVRPVETGHLRAIWDAHLEALRGHWGMARPEPDAFETWLKGDTFQPHLWQIAWDVENGQVAGQVKPWIDGKQNAALGRRRGYTEFISVGEPYRRRGLARALVARALRAQRDAGMADSELGVDGDNAHGAPRLYEACGFRVVKRNTVYRKPIAA
jgi:mycothiol synthase